MRKLLAILTVALLPFVMSCGGSSSSTSPVAAEGTDFTIYAATLPNGNQMMITVTNTGSVWSGTFFDTSTTGADAGLSGDFDGSVTGDQITATCTSFDGTQLQFNGSGNGKGFT